MRGDDFRAVMGHLAGAVTVITTVGEAGELAALTATAVTALSKSPPLCVVCVDEAAEANPVIAASRRFAVNLLASHQAALSDRFATTGIDKFDGVRWKAGPATGCPLLQGALAHFECVVVAAVPGGDHTMFVGELRGMGVGRGSPLVYYRGRYGTFARGRHRP